jgi:DNA-binding MarR family transcriptional regulator
MSRAYHLSVQNHDQSSRRRWRGPPAFLLAQVGAHAAAQFAERIAPLGLTPPQAGILRAIASDHGLSQQELSKLLGIFPSRLVTLVDELESRGLIERRDNPEDRRTYALHLTEQGRELLDRLAQAAKGHNQALCAALNDREREQLANLLARIADEQGLTPGVHPGFRGLGKAPSS